MTTVPKIEMHLAHACNLACTGCTHYSDHGLSGVLDFQTGRFWLETWAQKVQPLHFTFLGGEPLLNRHVGRFLRTARELWPATRIRLVTNGLLLHRQPSLWDDIAGSNVVLTVSIHSREEAYEELIRPNIELARRQASERGFAYEERNSVDGWYKLYRGSGSAMQPFDYGDPRRSWSVCQNKHCVTLQNNRLWKCPPLAHLPRVTRLHGLEDDPAWQPYLDYEPLSPDATADEIRRFFGRGPEPSCGMCPVSLHPVEKSVFRRLPLAAT